MDNHTLKIVSFNLRRNGMFDKNKWNKRKGLIAQVIINSGANIIGVQELMPNMKKDLGDLLDGYSIFGEGRSKNGGDEHSAIIVKDNEVEVLSSNTFWLSKTPDKIGSRALFAFFPRVCTVIEVFVKPLNRNVRVFNTHFDHISPIARKLSVDTIIKTINSLNKIDPMPYILTGDLNAKPYSKSLKNLITSQAKYSDIKFNNIFSYFDIEDQYLNTYHAFKGKLKKYPIDYIFFSNHFDVDDVKIIRNSSNGIYPSDHFPIMANLKLSTRTV